MNYNRYNLKESRIGRHLFGRLGRRGSVVPPANTAAPFLFVPYWPSGVREFSNGLGRIVAPDRVPSGLLSQLRRPNWLPWLTTASLAYWRSNPP